MSLRPLVVVSLTLLSACVSWSPMNYSARPERITDPRAQLKAFVDSNTSPGCVTSTDFTESTFVAKYVCGQGVGQYLIRLDRVAGIALDRSDSLFRVVVTHTDSTPPFEIWVKNQDDVERFADAIAALSGVKPRVARPPSEA